MLEDRLAGKTAEERAAALKQFDEAAKAAAQQTASRTGGNMLLGGMPRMPGGNRQNGQQTAGASGNSGEARRPLWFLEANGGLSLRMVRTGVVDGTNTELVEADSLEGLSVIVRQK
jgi:hypothetical protein